MATHFLNCDFVFERIQRKGDPFEFYGEYIVNNTSPYIKIKSIQMEGCGLYSKMFPLNWEIKKRHRNNILPFDDNHDHIWCYCYIEVEVLQPITDCDIFNFLEKCLKENPTKELQYVGVNAIFHDENEMNRLVNCPCTEEENIEE